MTISQVEEILRGDFQIPEERQYWVDKLEDMKRKEKRARNNEEYFNKMRRYDR